MADAERDEYEDEFEGETDDVGATEGKGDPDAEEASHDDAYEADDFDADDGEEGAPDPRDGAAAGSGDAEAADGEGDYDDGDQYYDDEEQQDLDAIRDVGDDAPYEGEYDDRRSTSQHSGSDRSYGRRSQRGLSARGYGGDIRATPSVGRSSATRSVEHALGAGALTAKSRRILARQSQKRNLIKQRMARERQMNARRKQNSRILQVDRWRRKTSKSPFAVDLLAEHERMDEEMRVREQEQARRDRLLAKRREQVKAEIIVKALAEESDLEALRAEKRAILQEEQRLKALLELEKAKLHRKADMQAAVRAERQRSRAKKEYRRDKYSALQKQRQETVRQQNMFAQGLITDPKTGHAVRVESEEGWFALQELVRAGKLPDRYRPYLEAGAGAAPGVAVLEARAVADAERRRRDESGGHERSREASTASGVLGGGGGMDSTLSMTQGGSMMMMMGDSMLEGTGGGGMVLAGTVQGENQRPKSGDAIDAMMGDGEEVAYDDEADEEEDDYEEDHEDDEEDRRSNDGAGGESLRGDASAALSRLQAAN